MGAWRGFGGGGVGRAGRELVGLAGWENLGNKSRNSYPDILWFWQDGGIVSHRYKNNCCETGIMLV